MYYVTSYFYTFSLRNLNIFVQWFFNQDLNSSLFLVLICWRKKLETYTKLIQIWTGLEPAFYKGSEVMSCIKPTSIDVFVQNTFYQTV